MSAKSVDSEPAVEGEASDEPEPAVDTTPTDDDAATDDAALQDDSEVDDSAADADTDARDSLDESDDPEHCETIVMSPIPDPVLDQPTIIMPIIAAHPIHDEPTTDLSTLRNGRTRRADAAPSTPAPTPLPVSGVPVATQFDNLYQAGKERQEPATGGWRRAVRTASGGLISVGESRRERLRRQLTARASVPIRGDFRVAVLSLKGGVGKTTTTAGLGATLASVRGDRVIAVDASPEIGTLALRGPNSSASSAQALLKDKLINRYSDVREHTSQTENRLEILASEQNPAKTEPLSVEQYSSLMAELRRYYNVILTDCGTGLVQSTLTGVLDWAHVVVTVTSPTADAVRSATVTLEWLHSFGHPQLAASAIVVVCAAQRPARAPEVDRVVQHFQRYANTHYIPFDEHVARGTDLVLSDLNSSTRDAFLELAAGVADRSREL